MLRKGWMALAISLSLAAGTASAGHCELDFDSDYALRLDHGDLEFTSHDNQGPQKVRIEGSRVFVDGKELSLSAEQRARVADFSQNVGALARDAAEIGLEGVDIAYVAVTEVAKMFQDDAKERRELNERLDRSRAEVRKSIATFAENGSFNEQEFERLIEDNVETVVGDLVGVVVGEIVGEAISIALSGDEAKAKELEARADALEKTIEEKVESRAKALEKKADALCERAKSLGDLDNAMALRTDQGTAIDLLR
ncbi:hypothetical protein C7S18_22925 [Ahniella affigens]|uniref:DUF2884 domain-containing protein n=1 Tax=Ahniella affigens TaxID=2021234 RepID=A0A2P1PYE6_9GAMM|nr:DUF2884 family protein [Ahniella affigens]AVP99853.1 hypothetical protein C7S18_22925 [Ahniella affigens]